ncbi:MAG: MBL fold metallo-hydrolase [Myxococcales bacterium]|nr:MBL fold metallo-hydrolase [Myxococcales bacterium]MCB9530928.1 MBL fold metallo-hydrolase [Myxococcales bacterium]MCB9534530.1 MBL fold metallo-hydrolase [Myxococcales bacterium]
MNGRVREVAEGVYRLRLDSDCGLVVNAYAVLDRGELALIDAGFPHTVDQLDAALAELGYALEDVGAVLYTHTHPDHMGGGVAAAHRWDPTEYVWEGTGPAFGDWVAHAEEAREPETWASALAGPAAAHDERILEVQAKPRYPLRGGRSTRLASPTPVAFGEVVRVGRRAFRCVDARGHDPFHCAWLEESERWLFSGDVVLAVPTPLSRRGGDDPRLWIDTLGRWRAQLEVATMFPGHGLPSSLFVPSIDRSAASLRRIYDEAVRQARGSGASALSVTRALLPRDTSRHAARSGTLLVTADSVLWALSARGELTEEAGVYFGEAAEVMETGFGCAGLIG